MRIWLVNEARHRDRRLLAHQGQFDPCPPAPLEGRRRVAGRAPAPPHRPAGGEQGSTRRSPSTPWYPGCPMESKTPTASPSPKTPKSSCPRCCLCPAWATPLAATAWATAAALRPHAWPRCSPNPSPWAGLLPTATWTSSGPRVRPAAGRHPERQRRGLGPCDPRDLGGGSENPPPRRAKGLLPLLFAGPCRHCSRSQSLRLCIVTHPHQVVLHLRHDMGQLLCSSCSRRVTVPPSSGRPRVCPTQRSGASLRLPIRLPAF